MTNDVHDQMFLKEALPQMQDYLLSNELYWPLNASMPRLTPGAVLFALARLRVSHPDEARLLLNDLDFIRVKWRTAWDKKIGREISNRYRLWSNFLSDCVNNPEQNLDSYATEVRSRVILQLLILEYPDFVEKASLVELDAMLKKRLHEAEFLWESGLQAVFPKSEYWFLYGKL